METLHHQNDAGPDTLLSACRDAAREGQQVLHIFPDLGSVRIAVWRKGQREIDEVEVGPGPYRRPSRSGFPSLRFAEELEFAPEVF